MNDESTTLYQLSSSSYIWSGHSRNILDILFQHDLKYLHLLHLLPRWSQTSLAHSDLHEVVIISDLTIFSKSQSRRVSNVLLIISDLQYAGSEFRVLHDQSDIQVFLEYLIDKYAHLRDYNLVFEKFRVRVIVITDFSIVEKKKKKKRDWCVVSMISSCFHTQIRYHIKWKSVQLVCSCKIKSTTSLSVIIIRSIKFMWRDRSLEDLTVPDTENIALWSCDEEKE